MNDFEILTLTGLGVFLLVMAALVYLMTRGEDNNDD